MTTQKLFKRRVRARMSKTGESYTAARRHVAPPHATAWRRLARDWPAPQSSRLTSGSAK